jgi:hypothetical protein
MKGIIGYYSELRYTVCIVDNGQILSEAYIAGNSPHDSQCFVSADRGVGLKTMRSYCIQTSKEIAKEENLKYLGVERDDEDE